MQSRETALQVLPSASTSEGPAVDQRQKPLGLEECHYAAVALATLVAAADRTTGPSSREYYECTNHTFVPLPFHSSRMPSATLGAEQKELRFSSVCLRIN